MKWRMEKHTSDHRVDIKSCHYFNNDKPCPYDKVGCKFKHETAPECRFNLKCTFKLCQFTHTTKKGEEVVHREELETHNEGVVVDNEESYDENDDSDTDTSYNRQLKKNMAMNDTDMKMKYDAFVERYCGQDYPSDMIDTDSSDDEEMTIKDYERMMKSIW